MSQWLKRVVTVLSVLACAGVTLERAAGQDQRGGGLIARVQQELDQLNLTDEQKTKTSAILEKAREQFRELAPELIQAEPSVRRQKMNQFLSGLAEQIKPVLDESQRGEFETRIARMRAQPRPGMAQPQDGSTAPADRPGSGQGMGPVARPGMMLERLREAAESLDLTQEQRGLVAQLLADTRDKLQAMRGQLQGEPPAAIRERLMPIVQEAREKLNQILTPPQREKLAELMSNPDGLRRGRGGPDGRPDQPPMMQDMRDRAGAAAPATAPIAELPEIPAASAVGAPAPDFDLKKLDGQNLQLSAYKGKIVLIIFGSYTSPSFRQRVPQLERLRREYGTRINPIIIYTSENHPVGQWEVQRNKEQGISVEQPAEMDARIALARRAREALKITVPMVIDTMDDATMTAYGGTTNAAILIGRDGTILARQKWFEPYALRGEIDAALK
jgi:Spy/CpxP family protein refolding chaperone